MEIDHFVCLISTWLCFNPIIVDNSRTFVVKRIDKRTNEFCHHNPTGILNLNRNEKNVYSLVLLRFHYVSSEKQQQKRLRCHKSIRLFKVLHVLALKCVQFHTPVSPAICLTYCIYLLLRFCFILSTFIELQFAVLHTAYEMVFQDNLFSVCF